MASIRKRRGKYQVEIRRKGYPFIRKTFIDLKDARKFGRTVESQMERNIFEDYSNASGTTLRQILIKYRDEKTALKKGSVEETSKINYLIKDKIGLNSLMRLKSHHLYKLMKELSVNRKPATVNKYINIICHAWRVAKRIDAPILRAAPVIRTDLSLRESDLISIGFCCVEKIKKLHLFF